MAAYTEAIKGAITAADNAAAAVTTASFSLATAYGALVGLVKPSSTTPGTIQLAIPFIGFAIAAILGTVARLVGTGIKNENAIAEIRSMIRTAVWWKRGLAGVGIVVTIVALIAAGWIVVNSYAKAP